MVEDRRVWIAVLVLAAITVFFCGFKYADYRRNQLEKEKLATQELVTEDETQPPTEPKERSEKIFVHITGAVENPGVFEVKAGDRVFEVLEKARPTADADINQLNLAQALADQDKIVVPRIGEQLQPTTTAPAAASGGLLRNGGGAAGAKVNINTASVSELDEALPGIGPALAQRIVDYREQHGGFKSPDEITEVSGIGDKRYEQIKDLITVR